jgi:hypothetical protein
MSMLLRRARRLTMLVGALLVALAVASASASAHDRSFGSTSLKLDPGAVSALTGLGVTPAPIAPATATAADELAFPITNPFAGTLRFGVIHHSGGISLTAGSTSVALTDFDIDLLRRQLSARIGDTRAAILSLDFARARVVYRAGTLRIGPVGATVTPGAAAALDGAFGLPAGTVPAGLKLGDATVRYRLYARWH